MEPSPLYSLRWNPLPLQPSMEPFSSAAFDGTLSSLQPSMEPSSSAAFDGTLSTLQPSIKPYPLQPSIEPSPLYSLRWNPLTSTAFDGTLSPLQPSKEPSPPLQPSKEPFPSAVIFDGIFLSSLRRVQFGDIPCFFITKYFVMVRIDSLKILLLQ